MSASVTSRPRYSAGLLAILRMSRQRRGKSSIKFVYPVIRELAPDQARSPTVRFCQGKRSYKNWTQFLKILLPVVKPPDANTFGEGGNLFGTLMNAIRASARR